MLPPAPRRLLSTRPMPRLTERGRDKPYWMPRLLKRRDKKKSSKLKLQEMHSSVRAPVNLRLLNLMLSRLTKLRLLSFQRSLNPVTRTRPSSSNSEELTKPPRLPRPTLSEMDLARSSGMLELTLVLTVSELSLLKLLLPNWLWPRRPKSSQKTSQLLTTWELLKPTSSSSEMNS
jgi:hypothetical protein